MTKKCPLKRALYQNGHDMAFLILSLDKEWVELIEPNNRLFQCTTPKV